MKLNLWIVVSILLLVVAGCAALDQVFLPHADGTPADVVGTVDTIGGVATVATTMGVPWAGVVSGFCGLFGAIAGIYARMRGKQAAAANDKTAQTTAVMAAVVAAIEAADGVALDDKGKTIGGEVKKLVAEKLEDKDIYQIGKALIVALKTGLPKE